MGRRHSIDSLGVFTAFAVFAALSVLLILTGVGFYRRVDALAAKDAELRDTTAYLANKLRGFDQSGAVAVQELAGTDCLVLRDGGSNTYLYCDGGYLKEYTADAALGFVPAAGDRITEAEAVAYELTGSRLKITVKEPSGEIAMSIYLRSAQ